MCLVTWAKTHSFICSVQIQKVCETGNVIQKTNAETQRGWCGILLVVVSLMQHYDTTTSHIIEMKYIPDQSQKPQISEKMSLKAIRWLLHAYFTFYQHFQASQAHEDVFHTKISSIEIVKDECVE